MLQYFVRYAIRILIILPPAIYLCSVLVFISEMKRALEHYAMLLEPAAQIQRCLSVNES